MSPPNEHQLFELLLGGEMPLRGLVPPVASAGGGASKEGKASAAAATAAAAAGSGAAKPDEAGGGGASDLKESRAVMAKLAAEEEAAAVANAVSRAQRLSARQATEHALLLQLERQVDEAFRAHEHRVWRAAHPATAASLEKSAERVRQLQGQLSQVYEQIRNEHAQQLHLRAQIESRTGNTSQAAASRAESMLDAALKSARAAIVAAAAQQDAPAADGASSAAAAVAGAAA